MTTAPPLSRAQLGEILENIGGANVALVGDLCLDAYWMADMRLSALSRETPHHPLPIFEERYAPGGAGNVASNLAALKPARLSVVGVAGEDWRGDLLLREFRARGIGTEGIVRDGALLTNAYIKPLRRGISDLVSQHPRLDFENRAPLPARRERRVLNALKIAEAADVICVSDQMQFGCVTAAVRERLCELGRMGKRIVVDSRDRIGLYRHVSLKPNEVEAARAFAGGEPMEALAARLAEENGQPAVITLAEKGALVAEGEGVFHCPACPVAPPIDFVGAGDSFLAGFGCALAAGASAVEAAQVATLLAAVTIKKIGTTGTATREEILSAWELYRN